MTPPGKSRTTPRPSRRPRRPPARRARDRLGRAVEGLPEARLGCTRVNVPAGSASNANRPSLSVPTRDAGRENLGRQPDRARRTALGSAVSVGRHPSARRARRRSRCLRCAIANGRADRTTPRHTARQRHREDAVALACHRRVRQRRRTERHDLWSSTPSVTRTALTVTARAALDPAIPALAPC